MSNAVEVTISGGIGRLCFNRPDRMNVIDVEMAEAFRDAVTVVLAEPSVRVVLITGAGRSFAAGGDLAAFRRSHNRDELARSIIGATHDGLKRLAKAPAIVLCAVQGPLAGAGMSILSFADLAIAAETATFNMAYVRVGVSPDCGGSWSLPRLVGLRRAFELALLAETISADEALTIGLVNRLVPDAGLDEAAMSLAHRLACGPYPALVRTKALLRDSFDRDFATQLDAEEAAFAECAAGSDFSEALEAFFERRQTAFSGG